MNMNLSGKAIFCFLFLVGVEPLVQVPEPPQMILILFSLFETPLDFHGSGHAVQFRRTSTLAFLRLSPIMRFDYQADQA